MEFSYKGKQSSKSLPSINTLLFLEVLADKNLKTAYRLHKVVARKAARIYFTVLSRLNKIC